MSRRTAEADKAIRNAWKRERELVLVGQGTRDWTPEQQKSIIEMGKAYDENGVAFRGHHMKSAEKYPEYQGEADNIQFLTQAEHLLAHKGSFQTPSNGYYNPTTGEIVDFGEGKYIPCKVFELTNPIQKTLDLHNDIVDVMENKEKKRTDLPPPNKKNTDSAFNNATNTKEESSWKKRVLKLAGIGLKKIENYVVEHPEVVVSVMISTGQVLGNVTCATISGCRMVKDVSQSLSSENSFSVPRVQANHNVENQTIETNITRSSPIKHNVTGYERVRFGKTEHVSSYIRGGKT